MRHAGGGRAACPEAHARTASGWRGCSLRRGLHAARRPRAAGRATPTRAASFRSTTTDADSRSHLHLFARPDAAYGPAAGHAAYPGRRLLGHARRRPVRARALRRRGPVRARRPRPQRRAELRAVRRRPAARGRPGQLRLHADPAERNRFRSTACPTARCRSAAREQNELRSDYLFAMEDRARARSALEWEPEAGRPRGVRRPPRGLPRRRHRTSAGSSSTARPARSRARHASAATARTSWRGRSRSRRAPR